MKKTITKCSACGSTNVFRDACLSLENGEYSTYDSRNCGDCDYDGFEWIETEIEVELTNVDRAQSIADAVFDALIAAPDTLAEMHAAMECGASLNLSYTAPVAPKPEPGKWVNVSVRRDRITGRPILFFYNQNTRGYWLECYDGKGQHAECAPSYMRKFEQCTHDNPHGLALVARWDALPGANGHKARPVTRLMPPRGLPYIGK